ncbi:MAG TPA: molybdopterin synthase sulfur carrier subunit [Clostridiales bacterium]|nr:molybdopterin synthase sulfur carrier subunit [Clostridiales bacterium]
MVKTGETKVLKVSGPEGGKRLRFLTVTLSLYAGLDRHLSSPARGPLTVEVQQGLRVADVLEDLRVPREEVKVVIVNHRLTGLDHVLADGDRVAVFPTVAGG